MRGRPYEFSDLDGMMHRCCLRLLDSPAKEFESPEIISKVPGKGRIVHKLDVAPMSKLIALIGRSRRIEHSYMYSLDHVPQPPVLEFDIGPSANGSCLPQRYAHA